MRVEFLGARCSRWLDRVGRPWLVREDGVAVSVGEAGSTAYYNTSQSGMVRRLQSFVKGAIAIQIETFTWHVKFSIITPYRLLTSSKSRCDVGLDDSQLLVLGWLAVASRCAK